MRNRLLLIVASLVVALLGTAVVFAYTAAQQAPKAQAAEPQTRVLVARALIPAGTTGQQAVKQNLVSLQKIPTRLVPTGALVDVVAVQDHEAVGDIQVGEVLLPSRFVSTTVAGSIAIPDDKVAVSIEVADPQRVAGFVRPGLDVALFNTYEVKEPEQEAGPGAATPVVREATRLLLPRVSVIAVGPTAARTIGAPRPSETDGDPARSESDLKTLVTLAVTIEQAQKVAHASQTGKITLGLLSKESRTGTGSADDNRTLFE